MTWIRTAVKALVIREGRLLLNRCRNDAGVYYALPGGGQQVGETLDAALRRECREEIGVEVEVGPLRFVRDHIVSNHLNSYVREAPHQLEHLFECSLPAGQEPSMGPVPDEDQLGVAWLSPGEMQDVVLKPSWLIDILTGGTGGALAVYQGDRD